MRWTMIGAVLGAIGVGLGAFGAHGLRARVGERELEVWETAARYHLLHALLLVGIGLFAASAQGSGRAEVGKAADLAGWATTVGIGIFSGSLYVLVLSGIRKLGMVTPLGGLALMAGWALLARAAWLARG